MEVWLYLDSRGITQSQWEAVWNECHEILQRFPVPLASPFYEKKWGHECKIYKSQLIRSEEDQEYLCIQGDMASLAFGGRFVLHRNISHYQASTEDKDILRVDEKDIDNFSSEYRIWENGTGGAPYSFAVLALGILLENRFPDNCYMYGFEYSDTHIENICAWLSGALKANMVPPLCNDTARLWERLLPLYPNIDLAVRRFCKLVKTSAKKCFEFLIEQGCSAALENELVRKMSSFASVSQWGVIDLLYPYLEATQDVEQVAFLVKRVHEQNNKEGFSLEELLKGLVSKGITTNPIQAETVKEWNEPGDGLVTNMEGFHRLFLRMGGLPGRIDYYISPDNLLEIFACTEPANGLKFKEIIESGTQECLDSYKKLEDTTDKLMGKMADIENLEQANTPEETMSCWIKRQYLPYEDYILHEVESQVQTFPNPGESSLRIAKKLGKMMKDYDKESEKENEENIFRPDSREKILKNLSFFVEDSGFGLRETAWNAIDNESDTDILIMLSVYAGVHIQEHTTWEFRKYIFETPTLWKSMRDAFLEN